MYVFLLPPSPLMIAAFRTLLFSGCVYVVCIYIYMCVGGVCVGMQPGLVCIVGKVPVFYRPVSGPALYL